MARVERPIGDFWDHSICLHAHGADTAMQALMECRPDREPGGSMWELQPLREAVAVSMATLSAEDQYLLNAWHVERITIRDLAERMGLHKSYTYRLVKRAETRLRDRCLLDTTIQGYLGVSGAILPVIEGAVDGVVVA